MQLLRFPFGGLIAMLATMCLLVGLPDGAHAQSYTSPGAWSLTVPAGVTMIEVRMSGGGGGGGGAGGFTGPAGGAGGNGSLVVAEIAVTAGQVLSGTVGAGGGTGYLTGSSNFGLTPCAGNGASGSGASAGGTGGKTVCLVSAASGGGGGGGGSTTLALSGVTLLQAGGGGGGGGAGGGVGGAGTASNTLSLSAICGNTGTGGSPVDFLVDGGGGGGGGGGFLGGAAGLSQIDAFTATGGTAGSSCYSYSSAIAYTAISSAGAAGSAGDGGGAIAPGGTAANGYVQISTGAISLVKSSKPVADPVNSTANPKLIPGATFQYCVTLSNGWARDATSVAISDPVPAQATYVNGSARSGVDCTSAAAAVSGLSYSAPVLTVSPITVAAGSTYALTFQATVN